MYLIKLLLFAPWT